MKMIKHRDGSVSVRMDRTQFDGLIESANFAYVHWQNVAERSLITGRDKANLDAEIRDEYKTIMDDLVALAEGTRR